MARPAVPTVATGDLWTAANQNTYLRDYMAAIFGGAEAGKFLKWNALADTVESGDGGAPLLRQGGSATDYSVEGTNEYTEDETVRQAGAVSLSVTSGSAGAFATVTFNEAFGDKPLPGHLTLKPGNFDGTTFELYLTANLTASSMQIALIFNAAQTATRTHVIYWSAEGPPG